MSKEKNVKKQSGTLGEKIKNVFKRNTDKPTKSDIITDLKPIQKAEDKKTETVKKIKPVAENKQVPKKNEESPVVLEENMIKIQDLSENELDALAFFKEDLTNITPSERSFADLCCIYQLEGSGYEVFKNGKKITFDKELKEKISVKQEHSSFEVPSSVDALSPEIASLIEKHRERNKDQIQRIYNGSIITSPPKSQLNKRASRNPGAMTFLNNSFREHDLVNEDQHKGDNSPAAICGRNIMRAIQMDNEFARHGKINANSLKLIVERMGGQFIPTLHTNDLGSYFLLRGSSGTLRYPEDENKYIPTM